MSVLVAFELQSASTQICSSQIKGRFPFDNRSRL